MINNTEVLDSPPGYSMPDCLLCTIMLSRKNWGPSKVAVAQILAGHWSAELCLCITALLIFLCVSFIYQTVIVTFALLIFAVPLEGGERLRVCEFI